MVRKAKAKNTKPKVPRITNIKDIVKLNADEVNCILSFLELPTIIAFKTSCKRFYTQISKDEYMSNRIFNLALLYPPPLSKITSDESEDVMFALQERVFELAEREWAITEAKFERKLKPLRETQNLSQDQLTRYHKLLMKLTQAFLDSHLEKKEVSMHAATALTDVHDYMTQEHSLSGGQINAKTVLEMYATDGYFQHLTVQQRESRIKEVIALRLDAFYAW
jgi:hypothetical protein